ncbi:MAG: hypothetical protein JXA57_15665 [Armatimonadetes bacterium]|nr:hypothetical protein [Armatimonadota bacterium]
MAPIDPPPLAVTIGCDIGKLRDPTAFVVTEQRPGDFHVVRHLERLPLGTSYPKVAERLFDAYRNVVAIMAKQTLHYASRDHARTGGPWYRLPDTEDSDFRRAQEHVWVMVDATGCGLPVVDFLRERSGIADGHLTAVILTAGEHTTVSRGAREGSVSKAFMVSRLQTLFGDERLKLPNTEEAKACASELEDFEVQIAESATATYNARPGSHDDLITALALSVLIDEARHESGSIRYA